MSKQNIIIINPLTQRPVKYGSRVYKQLIKDGVIGNGDEEETTQQHIKPRQPMNKQPTMSKQSNNYDYEYDEPPKQKQRVITKTIKSTPIKIEYKQSYEDEIDKLLNDAFTIDLKTSRTNNKIHYEEEEDGDEENDDEDEYE